MKRWIIALLLAGLALLAPAARSPWALGAVGVAHAATLAEDKVVVGDNFTLSAGDEIDGNLIVLGGNVTVEDGARVTGNLVVFGGNVSLAGEVGEDLVVFGGNAELLGTAVVEGQLVTSGGSISRAEGSEVKGGETQSVGPSFPWRPVVVTPTPGPLDVLIDFIWGGVRTVALAVVISLLAVLVALLLPEPTARVSAALAGAPVAAGGVGLLTLIAVPVLSVLMAITLCLIPFSFLALMAYTVALLFGWLALGALLGERLAGALRWQALSPVLAAGLGAGLITLVVGGIGLLPVFGGLLSGLTQTVLLSLGLGAVTLTRFGARPYLTAAPLSPAAPPPSAPEPPPAPPPGDPGL
ncbi:MAG: polymer-forming cytoskeletal protein [Anaerolineales bacterium]|nr:polymer-forming cytoskeletal protein [Anaerolineales bacterium]